MHNHVMRALGSVVLGGFSLASSVPSPVIFCEGKGLQKVKALQQLESEVVVMSCHRQLFHMLEDGEMESSEGLF